MREIKFRGLTTKEDWVIGSLVVTNSFIKHMPKQHSKNWIVTSSFGNGGWFNIRGRTYVKEKTVGQFTGKKDKDGIDIFQDDLIQNESGRIGRVLWNGNCLSWDSFAVNCSGGYFGMNPAHWSECVKVIGNAHDNPELSYN